MDKYVCTVCGYVYDPVEGDPDRPGYIVFTSGTSEAPVSVIHAHRAILARRMMFDVFSHSFFNPEEHMSAADLLMMFHFYFSGNPEGLIFDVSKLK